MIIQRRYQCICNSKKPHFCPPCLGEEGFYACDPEDIAANVIELQAKLIQEEQVNLDLDMQLSLTLKHRNELVVSLHNAEAIATKWGEDSDKLAAALKRALQRCLDAKVAGYREYKNDAALLKRIGEEK